jgi:RimJ/RimL family protein N-acetyltransferase
LQPSLLSVQKALQHFNAFKQPIGIPLLNWKQPQRPLRHALVGEYCSIQPLEIGLHAKDLNEANCLDDSGSTWTYLPYGPFDSLSSYQKWLEEFCQGDDPMFFAIVDLSTGRPSGVASFLRIIPESGSIEVGHVHFSPLLQRSRVATEAMYLMMKHAFDLGYRRYEWKCDALNAPSRSAASRLGFSFEGIFRQATVYRERNRDTAWFSIIDSEWPHLNAAFKKWLSPENFDNDGLQRISLRKLTSIR